MRRVRSIILGRASDGFRVGRVAELLDLKPEQVLAVGKYKKTVAARSLLCFWATSELGISQNELGQKLKISQPAVNLSVKRGEQLVIRHNYSLTHLFHLKILFQ